VISNPEPGSDFTMGPAGEFMRSLWRLNHVLERASRSMETSAGVTAEQRAIIRYIGKYPGIVASQLAALLHLDAGTVSASLGRLERKGLIDRRRGHRDKRRVTLGLTAAGRAIDQVVVGTVEHTVETLLETMSPDDVTSTRRVLLALTDLLEPEAA
jgi:DNA-binding MarR family transcriptional regulator